MASIPEHRSYEELSGGFTWAIAEKELEYKNGDVINIGWYCSDRICLKGNGSKIALIYEGFGGISRQFTYND
ncbi:hypothetical protein EG827_13675, partial [bacterium]|nr:hypothetical protein [bacterium]